MNRLKITEISEARLEDVPVMYVVAEGGPVGGVKAFFRLEKAVGSLRGRKFYGTLQNGEYRANVAIREEDNPGSLGLPEGKIPGGLYARRRVEGFKHSELGRLLPPLFEEMINRYDDRVDKSRPSIEFYRRFDEVILFLPIK